MREEGWIDASKRPPTKQDANATGCVLAWHRYNGCMVTGWHQFGRNGFLTHWQKTPGPPEGYPQWENPPGRAGEE